MSTVVAESRGIEPLGRSPVLFSRQSRLRGGLLSISVVRLSVHRTHSHVNRFDELSEISLSVLLIKQISDLIERQTQAIIQPPHGLEFAFVLQHHIL